MNKVGRQKAFSRPAGKNSAGGSGEGAVAVPARRRGTVIKMWVKTKKALQSQALPHSETASGEVAEWSKALPC
ncbi:protein of unknown function [Shinella sp. WSC3-e]|nr:hypothetical protein SHINE37_40725 [Rhizobiaceae bacterium]CAK7255397.1 protein of unknown function [Shinella sp. WSC3-e]